MADHRTIHQHIRLQITLTQNVRELKKLRSNRALRLHGRLVAAEHTTS